MKLIKKLIKPSSLLLIIITLLISFSISHAAFTGAIDGSNKTARFYDDTANLVNFKPSYSDPIGGSVATQIGTLELTGYAWGNTVGWVNLNSTNCDSDGNNLTDTGNFSFCTTGQAISTFKVAKSAGNTLSGYAFSQNGGWINFGPFTNSPTPQVTINPSTGNWAGYAWVENYGWLQFDCGATNACVKAALSSAGGGGGGSPQTNGTCDPVSNGGTFSSAPTNLCTTGIASPASLSGDGPWIWDCLGQNGGFDNYNNAGNSCSANFSSIAPPPPPPDETCEDISADNFGGALPCTYLVLPPPGEPCVGDECFCLLNPSASECNAVPVVPIEPVNPIEPVFPVVPVEPVGPGGEPVGPGGVTPGGILGGGTPVTPVEVINQITEIVNNPTVSAVTQVVTTAGLILGASMAIASALFVSPIATPELVMIPFRLWTLLLSFLGIRKQAKKWGTVYDSVTMQPLDPAYVVLKDAQGNEVGTSLTDIDGRYGFPVEPGTYTLYANKTDYQFPSAKLIGKDHDVLHKDLYFGENIIVRESGEIITKNIPMDRLNFNWNEWAKNQKSLMKFYSKRSKLIAEISSFFFGVGFTVATVALIFAPVGYNIGIFGLYVFLFVLRHTNILKAKQTGSISDQEGNPISFAIVRVYSAAMPDVEITHRVADKFGRFYALVPNGNYVIKVEEKTGEETYNTIFTSTPTAVTKGLIDNDFKINH